MQILHDAVLRDRYDVVVVGAGIGGLTAAALLAKRGLNTLVIEQHYMPGGACTTMRRRDITFDVAVAMLFGFGEKGFNPHRFVMNELEEEIDMVPHECLYRMHVMGKELTFWRDFERFFDELVAIFPNDRLALRSLYDYLYRLYDNVISKNQIFVPPTEMPLRENVKNFVKNPLGILRLLPMMFRNTEGILKKFISSPEVMAFFNMLTCTYCYCDVRETPAILSAAMFVENHEGGAFYPSGSPQMLSNKLEKVMERYGGTFLYRHLVDEILISEGKAYGVRLEDGTEIMAERIVANATVWNLYGTLVKPRHIKPTRMAWAQRFIPTFPALVIYLGVDAEAIPEGTPPILMIVEDIYKITGNDVTVYISSLDDPTLCPPGMHSITVVAPSLKEWPRPADPAYRSEEYTRLKCEEADRLLDQVEKHLPDLRRHIKVMEIATPTTIERFTLKNWGAVGGPKQMIGQEMLKRLRARSEWKNLYLCGDSTVMGIGIPATTVSGIGAANMVLRDLGLKEYLPRPFSRQYVNLVKGTPWSPTPDPTEPITEQSARRISKDCQHCEKPGCRDACPARIDTCYFARRIEAGNFVGAARVLREVNPLSEVCGYICPSERLCERNCNRLEFDTKPVRIRELHGWVCGHVSRFEGWERFVPTMNGCTIAVVGAGPAGLTCAHYLARAGYQIDIFDKADRPGGMLSHAIPTFRLSEDVVDRELEGLTIPGMNLHFGKALGKDITIEELERTHDAVFLAPGLWSGRTLEISGQGNLQGIDALSLLHLYRRTGSVEVGGRVLVIGGGSVASDAALVARRAGADKVTVVCLEREGEMPALAGEVRELKEQGITILDGWGPKEFVSSNRLSLVCCTSVRDAEGRFSPSYDESRTMDVEFDQVIMAVGQRVEPALATYFQKEFARDDLICVDEATMQIEGRPGVYAGGDIVRGAGTVVEAVADGRKAAMAIHSHLRGK